MKKIAFVIPWYGDSIRGGAETECNHLAHCLKASGLDVEILTTCVREAGDNRGKNTLQAGIFQESGITVHRFKVTEGDEKKLIPANRRIYEGENFSADDEVAYMENDINSPELYQYIKKERYNYDWFIFIPYLYPPMYYGSLECPDNCAAIPCFHDEGYAHMEMVKECANRMKKIIFLSQSEAEFARKQFGLESVDQAVLGAYVESGWEKELEPEHFREKYNIKNEFILCAGRKEPGKRTNELLYFFIHYKQKNPESNLKLVFIGGGEIDIPSVWKKEVIDLGFVEKKDKYNAYAAAMCLCNPSYYESFSLVIMESWLAKRPVLVSEHCEVTTNFAKEAKGGLFFANYSDFEGCIDYMQREKRVTDIMGENGYKYVQENFVSEVIRSKYIEFLEC